MKSITIIVTGALLALNLISFFLMGHDKQCARKNRRRVPEKTLFLSAILFGALGGTLGMYVFRHKTKHWYFWVVNIAGLIWQLALIGWLAVRLIQTK